MEQSIARPAPAGASWSGDDRLLIPAALLAVALAAGGCGRAGPDGPSAAATSTAAATASRSPPPRRLAAVHQRRRRLPAALPARLARSARAAAAAGRCCRCCPPRGPGISLLATTSPPPDPAAGSAAIRCQPVKVGALDGRRCLDPGSMVVTTTLRARSVGSCSPVRAGPRKARPAPTTGCWPASGSADCAPFRENYVFDLVRGNLPTARLRRMFVVIGATGTERPHGNVGAESQRYGQAGHPRPAARRPARPAGAGRAGAAAGPGRRGPPPPPRRSPRPPGHPDRRLRRRPPHRRSHVRAGPARPRLAGPARPGLPRGPGRVGRSYLARSALQRQRPLRRLLVQAGRPPTCSGTAAATGPSRARRRSTAPTSRSRATSTATAPTTSSGTAPAPAPVVLVRTRRRRLRQPLGDRPGPISRWSPTSTATAATSSVPGRPRQRRPLAGPRRRRSPAGPSRSARSYSRCWATGTATAAATSSGTGPAPPPTCSGSGGPTGASAPDRSP